MQSDRFAREIVAILAHSGAARSRRLMRNSFGYLPHAGSSVHPGCGMIGVSLTYFKVAMCVWIPFTMSNYARQQRFPTRLSVFGACSCHS
jgi:hypothetical protein